MAAPTREVTYPFECPECGKVAVFPKRISYPAEIKHDGKLYQFVIDDVPIEQCESCSEQFLSAKADDAIQAGLRTHLCLIQPHEIRQRLKELALTQTEFADRLGIAPETVSRWLNGHSIQNKAMDNLMRLFFGLDSVRDVLTPDGPVEGLGVARVRASDLSWVNSRNFPAAIKKRSSSFRLQKSVEESHVH